MFYAAIQPRGFANETTVYAFNSRADRNRWALEHDAYVITRREAMRIDAYKGDAITENFSTIIFPADPLGRHPCSR